MTTPSDRPAVEAMIVHLRKHNVGLAVPAFTDRKPDGPYIASSRLALHSDCWAVYRPGHGCFAEFYYRIDGTFPTFDDARRHAEAFAAKLNEDHRSKTDAGRA